MEFIQTVLVQVEAPRLGEASAPGGLLYQLDEHRAYLEQQLGFLDMRITRSINPAGNILLIIDTRWADDRSLVDYETKEPNVGSIVGQFSDLIVPNSLQVLDMEAIRPEAGAPSVARETARRLIYPLLLPAGVLSFALLIIYGLSRVYLEIPADAATGLAAAIAFGILLTAWFIAANPQIQGWQIASIGLVAATVLTGGAIYAVANEDEGEAHVGTPEATASPEPGGSPAPPGGADVFQIAAVPSIKFDKDEMTLPANKDVTVRFDNRDNGIPHNWAIFTDESASDKIAGGEGCGGPCQEDVKFKTPAPGEYYFHCDFHPQQMTGTVTVQ